MVICSDTSEAEHSSPMENGDYGGLDGPQKQRCFKLLLYSCPGTKSSAVKRNCFCTQSQVAES